MTLSRSKNYRIYTTIYIIVCLFIVSCKKKANQPGQFTFDDFKTQQSLTGTPVQLTDLNFETDMVVLPGKNLLFIEDLKDDFWMKVYDLKTFKFIKAFIKKGSGPNGQMDCSKPQYDKAEKYLYTIDRAKGKIFQYVIDDIIDPKKTVFPTADLTLDNNGLSKPLLLQNGNFVDFSIPLAEQPPSVFSFYNADGTPLLKRGKYPPIEGEHDPSEIRTAFEGQFFSSKDGKHIVLGYFNSDYIDVYDSTGNLQHRAHGPELFEPAVRSVPRFGGKMIIEDEGSFFAYFSPKMNGDSLLILYQGKGTPTGYHRNKLLLFDQKLQPKVLYNLKDPVFQFDIDWKTKTLYGLTHKIKGSNLIVYKLP